MINPLLNNVPNPMMQNLMNLKKMVQGAKNPQAMLNQMMQNNPQIKQAMDYINSNGGNAKDAFYKLAKEKGVNPDEIINQLKQ